MAGEAIEGINPTRMELLQVKKRRTLAEKGHKLLGEKRDALVVQFFDIIKKRDKLRKEVMDAFSSAEVNMEEAMAIMGYDTVKSYSRGITSTPDPELSHINIMGVKVPVVNQKKTKSREMAWSVGTTPFSLNQAADGYQKALDKLLQLAEVEGGMEKLAVEIEKTKRRVNALEHIFIPRLESTEKYINMQLQEREREEYVRRKRIKTMMEEKEKQKEASRDK